MRRFRILLAVTAAFPSVIPHGRAEEPHAAAEAASPPAQDSAASLETGEGRSAGATQRARAKPPQKQKRPREKEAEGTEAADRFEADTVIKSRYQLNGEYLEVDPD